MDISNEKISELLKNPEIIGMIASLAGNMGLGKQNISEAQEDKESTSVMPDDTPHNEAALPAISGNALPDVPSHVFSGNIPHGSGDRRVALLNAIKPYVSNSKRERVDGLVKAISVAGILNTYTGGLFGNGKQ